MAASHLHVTLELPTVTIDDEFRRIRAGERAPDESALAHI
jgi:hypothetical protein